MAAAIGGVPASNRRGGGRKAALNLADQNELARLRKENERLKMEREILTDVTHRPRNAPRMRVLNRTI